MWRSGHGAWHRVEVNNREGLSSSPFSLVLGQGALHISQCPLHKGYSVTVTLVGLAQPCFQASDLNCSPQGILDSGPEPRHHNRSPAQSSMSLMSGANTDPVGTGGKAGVTCCALNIPIWVGGGRVLPSPLIASLNLSLSCQSSEGQGSYG